MKTKWGIPVLAAATLIGPAPDASAAAPTGCADPAVRAQVLKHMASKSDPAGNGITLLSSPLWKSDAPFTGKALSPVAVVSIPFGDSGTTKVTFQQVTPASNDADVLLCEYRRTKGKDWSKLTLNDILPASSGAPFRMSWKLGGGPVGSPSKVVSFPNNAPAGGDDERIFAAVISPTATNSVPMGFLLTMAPSAAPASDDCVKSETCAIPASVTGKRRMFVEQAIAILKKAKASGITEKARAEKELYFPRRCTGFVIDAMKNAGLIRSEWLSYFDYNGGEDARTYSLEHSAGKAIATTPNFNVKYIRNAYCKDSNATAKGLTVKEGCVHPFTFGAALNVVSEANVRAGDLWVSDKHVGIVLDPARKIMIHNATSTGPTMDRWDSSYYAAQSNVIFVRHTSID